MNKLITKIAALSVGLAMAIGVGVAVGNSSRKVASVEAAESSYTFTSKSWGDSTSSWTSDKDGGQLSSGQGVQVTAAYSGAGAHSKTSFSNISAIEFTYCTNATKGVGSISVTIGSNAAVTYSVTKTGGTTARTTSQTYATPQSGVVTFTVSCSTNSIYVAGIKITTSSGKTVSSLTTNPNNGATVNLAASGADSVDSSISYQVGYSDSSTGYDVVTSSSPSANVTITDNNAGTLSLSFAANGTFEITVEADASHFSTITYVVTGVPTVEYELFTGTLVAGDYVFMSADVNYTYVLGNTIFNNRVANGDPTPTVSGNIIANPSNDYVWHIAKDGNYWTIQNASNGKYLAGTTSKNTASLVDSIDDHGRWTATYSSKWIFENLGRASDSDTPANKYLRNNTSSGWACYSSTQANAPALFKLVSSDPAIEVEVTGSTSLGVGDIATLTATKVNGATGTVNWAVNNAHVSLSANTGDSITVTGVTDGSTKVTASLTGGSTVDPVVTTFTVTKALSSIAVTTAPTKTTYEEGESFDKTGMVITATYDDASTETPSDYTWSPSGALTPSDVNVTISWGGKSTTQAITVNAKTVSSIAVQSGPTKDSYHAGDEFESAGLTIRVTYSDSTTADITSGFTLSPASYTFTDADVTAGSKTFTVTYSGKSTSFSVSVSDVTGPIPSGRYYIMNSTKTHGLNAVASTSSSPSALDLSVANELTPFDVVLMEDNEYEISVTISETKYYLVCNTTATSSSNTSIRIIGSPSSGLKSLYWNLDNEGVETEGAYFVKENTVDTTYRYLACYNTTDWRGYTGASGDREIQFVPEGTYAEEIANSLLKDITCDDGEHAPSTSVWGNISTAYGNIKIANEKALLTGGKADEESEDVIEQALARYDYIVGKYNKGMGIETYNDFLTRDPTEIHVDAAMPSIGTNNNVDMIIVIAAFGASTLFFVTLCIVRKRKGLSK